MTLFPFGGSCGVVLSFNNGIMVCNISDTNAFNDMKLIVRCTVHKSRLCGWGKFAMGIREAARATSFIRPDIFIRCHYGSEIG